MPYRLSAAGKGCSNVYKGLSLSAGSVQACADSACADPDCGQVFEVSTHGSNIRCKCVSPGQPCMEVENPSANWYEIGDMSTCAQSSGDCFATLFENGDFTGWSGSFTEGSFPAGMFEEHGAVDKGTSSLFVSGDGCTATVFKNADFSGWSVTFAEGSYSIDEFLAQGAVDDDVSAVTVRHGVAGASVQTLPSSAYHSTPPPIEEPTAKGVQATQGRANDATGRGKSGPPGPTPASSSSSAAASLATPRQLPAESTTVSSGSAPEKDPLHRAGAGTAQTQTLAPAPPAPGSVATPPPSPPSKPEAIRAGTPTSTTRTPTTTTRRAPRPAPRSLQSRAPAPPPWEPLKCDVTSKKGCSSEELAYIRGVEGSFGGDRSRLEHEAQRLKAKHSDVKPELRPWIQTRVQILQRLSTLVRHTEL